MTNRDEWLTQIEKSIETKGGDQWKKGRWLEFLKEVVSWLHHEKEQDDEDTIDAAAGLIVYGIWKQQHLINVADNKREFREVLEAYGIRPVISDMLFDKYVAPALPQFHHQDGE